MRARSGSIRFEGESIERKLPGDIVRTGMALVPEARRIFSRMTVLENLEMGAFIRNNRTEIKSDIDRVCQIFPRIKERLKQIAGTMSGGEQQMLAMGRADVASTHDLYGRAVNGFITNPRGDGV